MDHDLLEDMFVEVVAWLGAIGEEGKGDGPAERGPDCYLATCRTSHLWCAFASIGLVRNMQHDGSLTSADSKIEDAVVSPRAKSGLAADDGRLADDRKLVFIDTLRGLAILMVILVHHSQVFSVLRPFTYPAAYGQLGVQLFFVASAFTMCMSASHRREEPHPVSSFYIRRVFRIAPLYYVGILLYFLIDSMWPFFPTVKSVYTFGNVLANLLFVHGFVPDAYNRVVLGGWSIAAEMSFYLLFPLMYPICKQLHDKYGLIAIATLAALFVAVSAVFNLAVIPKFGESIANTNFWYCMILNQVAVFIVGMGTYFHLQRRRFFVRFGVDAAAFVALSVLSGAFLLANAPWAMVLLPATAGLSFAFLLSVVRGFGQSRIGLVERIGQHSYSMYIFHFVFAWTISRAILKVATSYGIPPAFTYFATLGFTIGATYLVAKSSKVIVEDRFIEYGRRLIKARDAKWRNTGASSPA
ncbi:acyltransferase family protein (plasmid) [Sphingobium yanoikuyae]|uniref:Acyltransferase family protein n=1 Tax=Sphingobium yanoikuyae TaxID=13690 RepID=A0A6P1GR90_SPHYA|nr:acyltransferase [Sphingobium yanoikuyae]QHD70734.1 acyltransferase family protein [Sphingobium yanoikuyae]